MNANELRIGNLVFHNGEIIAIKSIHPGDDDVNDEIPFHAIFGIPITEDWLLKCGFLQCEGKFGEYLKCSKLDGFRIWFHENEQTSFWSIGRKEYETDETTLIFQGVKYIHQLQNLYFALTQTELEIETLQV